MSPKAPVMKARAMREVAASVERAILRIRGLNVLLDVDLAALYGVAARSLNQAVARNPERFPADFMFRLTAKEAESFKITNCDLKDRPRPAS